MTGNGARMAILPERNCTTKFRVITATIYENRTFSKKYLRVYSHSSANVLICKLITHKAIYIEQMGRCEHFFSTSDIWNEVVHLTVKMTGAEDKKEKFDSPP